jgi:LysR family nitrogen assimilation transcriptional regulator
VAEVLEMDTMFGTLDFVARTDWSTVLPALLLDPAASQEGFSVHPIVEPRLSLDLVLIEPRRRPMTPPARAFCDLLRDEADRLNRSWLEIAGERPQTAVRPPSTTTDAPVM